MPRYYCDYCDAYLTHDSVSITQSPLIQPLVPNDSLIARSPASDVHF